MSPSHKRGRASTHGERMVDLREEWDVGGSGVVDGLAYEGREEGG